MKKLQDTEYTGTLPATLQTVAGYLESYKIWGNDGGVGAETENLFDESIIEVGGLSPSTGAEITNSARRRSGFISVEPSTNYGLSREITSIGSFLWVIAYDENKNIVTDATIDASYSGVLVAGTTLTVSQWAFATTPTTRYIRWYVTNNNSYGNIMLNLGTAPLPYEPYGYKLPIISNDAVTDIYIGDTQLAKDEYVDSETGQIYRYVDGTLTPTDPPVPLPQIPTFAGETIVDYGIAALPYPEGLDGVFEYGDIDGLAWKNSVSDENDITFDTAVTDTGTEYVLPAGASGQYTSKSGEYRTEFTWYCIAKCPTTCHSAGQYMISDLGNGIGVEISSGWTAYSSVGGNHLVRGVDNRDFNSAEAVTSYVLIVVSGDVNGMASIYVNGEKMTDSWNFNPVSSSGAAAVFLGKRASGQLSGTDIDYKFLAFGTTKQTDSEIAANSQYLMTKYLGVGRPEKVELDVHGWTNTLYSIYHQGKWINSAEKKRVNGKWI